MLHRQLFDPETSTYSYLLADAESREAVLIDPVRERVPRDLQLVRELGLQLRYALETHVHADHVTGGGLLREAVGCGLVVAERAGVLTADLRVHGGDVVRFGRYALEVRETPGHTDGCATYVCHEEGMAFTGDALLIRGCGRTDFQQGDARTLHQSVHEQIFSLPDETFLYPGHDYQGRTLTTVAEEKQFNPRLGVAKDIEAFVSIMAELQLAPPSRIDEALPANMASGVTEPDEPLAAAEDDAAWAPVLRTKGGVPVVASHWLAGHLDSVRVVDVREHIEYCGPFGHLPGAELVPLAALSEAARGWRRDETLVTVCAYGPRSAKAALLLAEQGFSHVASLHGGMARWSAEGRAAVEVLGDRARQDSDSFIAMNI